MSFYDRFLQTLRVRFPQTGAAPDFAARLSPKIVSSHILELPAHVAMHAADIGRAFFELRENPSYQEIICENGPLKKSADPGHYSALMSFDFHLTGDGRLKLIEINTNASTALVASLIYQTHGSGDGPGRGLANHFGADPAETIFHTFLEDFRLSQVRSNPNGVAIVDERPPEQKLFAEFLLYQELFAQHGLACVIADPSELKFSEGALIHESGLKIDLVYNRHTDFYLQSPATEVMRQAFFERAACLTPSPFEYQLLADKGRLFDLSGGGVLDRVTGLSVWARDLIGSTVLRTERVPAAQDADHYWRERKKFFFKPARSFGGKATYRGSTLSRSAFQTVLSGDYIAQEFFPAPTMKLRDEAGTEAEFKYDLRFYAYKDRTILAGARFYQGQMTNFQNDGGGMAAIRFV